MGVHNGFAVAETFHKVLKYLMCSVSTKLDVDRDRDGIMEYFMQ